MKAHWVEKNLPKFIKPDNPTKKKQRKTKSVKKRVIPHNQTWERGFVCGEKSRNWAKKRRKRKILDPKGKEKTRDD